MAALLLAAAGEATIGGAAICGTAWADPGKPITIQLKWRHQFQFAGYYAAEAQGYFRDAGLDVVLREAEADEDPVAVVVSGRADYGIGTSELVVAHAHGAPVVALAATYQHSPFVLVSRRRHDIETVHDLVGKRVMVEPQAAEIWAYLKLEGIQKERLTLVPHSFDTHSLLRGDVDAMTAYTTDEVFALQQAGAEVQIFTARSDGIDFYSDVLFTTRSETRSHPERVAALIAAVNKGWHWALAHPQETATLIRERYSPRKSEAELLYEAETSRPLMALDVVEFGYMSEGRWRHIADTYAALGMFSGDVSLDDFLFRHDGSAERTLLLRIAGGAAALALVIGLVGGRFYALSRRLGREVAIRQEAEAGLKAALAQEHNLLSVLAHDFRTPLSVVSASAQLIGYCLAPDDGRGQREIGKILAATRKLSDLIASCLAKDRLEAVETTAFVAVDVAAMLRRLVAEWQGLAPNRRLYLDLRDVEAGEAGAAVTVLGDAGLLGVAFSNLIDNALRYTPLEGRVIVAVSTDAADLIISVSDDGPGIPEDDRERVFEKYYRSPGTPATGGAGIGLSVVAAVIKAHGGRVRVDPGSGGRLVVTLPRAKGR